jgi:hypothetical protein
MNDFTGKVTRKIEEVEAKPENPKKISKRY